MRAVIFIMILKFKLSNPGESVKIKKFLTKNRRDLTLLFKGLYNIIETL